MKRKYGTKFLFDMRGFWSDERVEGGIWNLKNPLFKLIYNFFKKKEQQFLEQADYTISLTEDGKRVIHAWKHIKNNPIPIEVIPCCADLEHFNQKNVNPDQVTVMRSKLGIKSEDIILLYLGSLGTWYMLEEMLDFFKVLMQYKPGARFLFITKDDPVFIRSLAESKGVEADRLLINPAERQDLPNYLALADLSIFFIKPVFSKRASSPTKQGELMGMGIPIICNAGVGDTAEIIEKSGAGAVIADFYESAYHEVAKNIDNLLQISDKQISSGGELFYSLEKGIDGYLQVYEAIL